VGTGRGALCCFADIVSTPRFVIVVDSQSIGTSRGPAFVTGNIGSMDTIALPGSGEQGFLMNNGNGSSTLFAPDAVPQISIS
jgi:hypothetical protein